MSTFSVKKPYTVLVGVVLAIVLGIVAFTKMTADLLPSISLPYVIVVTTYPGASPETVEMTVTAPVESAMATVNNIENITSVSSENYSMVVLEFAQSADMNAVSLDVREKLDQVKSYWDDSIGSPMIMKLNPDMLPVMIAAVGVDGMNQAQISEYVSNTIIPELESIEGVASASATGLLEESVHVVIRQEKVDEINKQVYQAIDQKMKDAEQQLIDGRKELEDGEKQLLDGQKELENGQKELENGKKELENGKKELEDKQNEVNAQLALQKQQLTAAKTQLENIQSTLTLINQQNEGVKQIDAVLAKLTPIKNSTLKYMTSMARVIEGQQKVQGGDETGNELIRQGKAEIADLKWNIFTNELLQTAMKESPELAEQIAFYEIMGWDWEDPEKSPEVIVKLTVLDVAVNQMEETIEEPKVKLVDSINAATSGLGYDAYVEMVEAELKKQNITDLNKAITDINNGLLEIEKGQMTAAIEMANGKATISLGEYKLELATAQMDSAKEQMDSGLNQMDEARKQLEEGEQQLEDARKEAYEQANMADVLTVDTVKGLLTAQNFSMPAGYVTEDGVDYLVRVGDKPSSVEELAALPLLNLHMDGVDVITLGSVADIFYTDNSDAIYTNVNGSAGVMLTIQKQTGYSTGEVSDLLGAKFKSMMKQDEKLTILTLMDQGIYIDMVMDSILNNIVFGAGLSILILILFLKDLRPTIVVAFSIPISLVTAIVCMYFSGVTLNVISLSGLALGIGMLVDNSIVVIENIYRLRGEGLNAVEAAMEGAKEVAGAIVASTLTTVCVFLPIVFTEGITRQLFVDMGLTIGYSLFASLFIAMTVVPAMSSKLLTNSKEKGEGKFFGVFAKGYVAALKGALKVKPLVFLLVIGLLGASVALAFSNGTAFMADMDSTQLTVNVELSKDATLADTARVTDEVVERLMKMEDIQDVGAMTASSTLSLLTGGASSTTATSVYVVTKEDKKHSNDELADMIKEMTKDLEAEISIETSTMDMSALTGSGISIQVRGRDSDVLQKIALEVADIVRDVEGTTDVDDGLADAKEDLRILVDRNKAVDYGLTVAQVFTQVMARVSDAGSSTVLSADDKDYSVYVMHGNDVTLTRKLLEEIEITGTDADKKTVKIPLSEIATFEPSKSLSSINRASQTRYVQISAAIQDGYNVGLVSTDVEDALKDYKLPEGYKLVFSGENEMIVDAMQQVGLMMLLAVIFMYLIMVAQFQSLLSPFIIMFTIPLAFTGGFLGLFFAGSEVSVIALIGFVMLAGIIVNNGIVLIDYMNQLRAEGMEKHAAILEAGRTRLRPVLMTALTTILALSTMVFSHDMGSEMGKPMAIVTVGGLLYGTVLTLIVIPCAYDVFSDIGKKKDKKSKKTKKHSAVRDSVNTSLLGETQEAVQTVPVQETTQN